MASHTSDENEVIQTSGEPTATKKAQQHVDKLFNISLHIAVTGETGVGKSTFINAIRGLDDDNEGAAETSVVETASTPTAYPHPNMPNVTYWELPGLGTRSFKEKTFVEDVKFDAYDFFIIISSERLKENDIKLANEIKKRKKLFYFVRSKIDQVIQAESQKRNFDKEKTLSKIRENCQENLRDMGEPKVFLISSKSTCKYDFQHLVATLITELPEHKRSALLQSLAVGSMAILEEKVKIFKKAAWAAAALSGVVAASTASSISLACDAVIFASYFMKCYYSFGLDGKSIQKLSERVNKPKLKDLSKSPSQALASYYAVTLLLSVLGHEVCSLVPGVGRVAAALMSFTLSCKLLNKGLDKLTHTTWAILRAAGLE